jgi:hypothetical protein
VDPLPTKSNVYVVKDDNGNELVYDSLEEAQKAVNAGHEEFEPFPENSLDDHASQHSGESDVTELTPCHVYQDTGNTLSADNTEARQAIANSYSTGDDRFLFNYNAVDDNDLAQIKVILNADDRARRAAKILDFSPSDHFTHEASEKMHAPSDPITRKASEKVYATSDRITFKASEKMHAPSDPITRKASEKVYATSDRITFKASEKMHAPSDRITHQADEKMHAPSDRMPHKTGEKLYEPSDRILKASEDLEQTHSGCKAADESCNGLYSDRRTSEAAETLEE